MVFKAIIDFIDDRNLSTILTNKLLWWAVVLIKVLPRLQWYFVWGLPCTPSRLAGASLAWLKGKTWAFKGLLPPLLGVNCTSQTLEIPFKGLPMLVLAPTINNGVGQRHDPVPSAGRVFTDSNAPSTAWEVGTLICVGIADIIPWNECSLYIGYNVGKSNHKGICRSI